VICQNEDKYVLATRRQFRTRYEAAQYAVNIPESRKSILVECDKPTVESVNTELLEALKALTHWGREHTSPRDANSPHDLLIRAVAAIDKADAVIKRDYADVIVASGLVSEANRKRINKKDDERECPECGYLHTEGDPCPWDEGEPGGYQGYDHGAALAEGWLLAEDSERGLEIQRFDEAERFDGDDEALAHVQKMADEGDENAKAALRAIAEAKAQEPKHKSYFVGKVGTGTEGVFRYDTLAEAEAKIAELEQLDPEGVHAGEYFLDVPEEEVGH
jgi:hypothetical protein